MKHNFKVGDRVKVVKRVDKQEGWYNTWYKSMSNYIGNIYTISEICDEGIAFIEDKQYFYFPSDSLELIVEDKELSTEADIMQALLDGETLIDIEKSWYENIPEQGRLCWVRGRTTSPIHLKIIVKYLENSQPYYEGNEISWYEATPLTNEEIKQFLQAEDNAKD
jgi:hypothetical protein